MDGKIAIASISMQVPQDSRNNEQRGEDFRVCWRGMGENLLTWWDGGFIRCGNEAVGES